MSCVDAVGISLDEGKLLVPSGATLAFVYEGKALDSLDVVAYEVGPRGTKNNRIRHGVLVPPYRSLGKGPGPTIRRSGTKAKVFTDLPAGEYVLDVQAVMPEGSASYGFRLAVEG